MELFVGGNSKKIQGEYCDLHGLRCVSAFYTPKRDGVDFLTPYNLDILCDSGAFQNIKEGTRLSFEDALQRQLDYELSLKKSWLDSVIWLHTQVNVPDAIKAILYYQIIKWKMYAIASYDLLIDEKWIDGSKVKQRWQEDEAWIAVEETVKVAFYLASQRKVLSPRKLILGCQGVTARQYKSCVKQVLLVAQKEDWIGLGGWCILGKQQSWFNEFQKTLLETIPLIAKSPVSHVHLYGVMWLPALGVFQAICDDYGITCSTDSKRPLSDCKWKKEGGRKRAGVKVSSGYWRDNVKWWQDTCYQIQQTHYYKYPSAQLDLFLDADVG